MKKEELERLERILSHIEWEVNHDCWLFEEEDVTIMKRAIEFLYGES